MFSQLVRGTCTVFMLVSCIHVGLQSMPESQMKDAEIVVVVQINIFQAQDKEVKNSQNV